MDMYTAIFGAGTVGPFASRAFVPAFVTATLLRFKPEWTPWYPQDIVAAAEQAPTWFTSDVSLIILGVLAALEIAATKSPDLRAAFAHVDKYAKSLLAIVTYLGVVSTQDVAFTNSVTQQAGLLDTLPAMGIGIAVLWLGTLRAGAMTSLTDVDEDDDLGVQGLFSWAEDVWAFFGPVLILLVPVLMLILLGIIAGLLVLLRRHAEKKEERSKIPCANCGEKIYGAAVRCFACNAPNDKPRAISFLGTSLDEPAADLRAHPYELVRKKRCPVCATRFEKRSPQQTCAACGHRLFDDPDFVETYLQNLDTRLPLVLLASAGFSLVPIVGLIPGVIFYRLMLIGPLRRYIPRMHSIVLRWLVRIALFFLILLQLAPGAGGLAVPAMALLNYTVYRRAFRSLIRDPAVMGR